MNTGPDKYCLDANVLIQAWQKYYNPTFCPDYWNILIELGKQGRVFVPELVYEEITRTDDDLSKWLKESKIPIGRISESVTLCLQKIYGFNPEHKKLVDNIRGRSLADPWVIAHAMDQNAVVVTKEIKDTAINSKRIRIPNVCENMNIKWMDDFQMIAELELRFSCSFN